MNQALEGAIDGMGNEVVAYSVTRVTSPIVFARSVEQGKWDLVIAADVELCETTWQCDTVDEIILKGNSIFTLTTPGPEDEAVSEVKVIDPVFELDITTGEPTVTGLQATLIPASASLHDIACVIEWFECRLQCILDPETPPLTEARRLCDQACNQALANCAAQ